MTYTDSYNSKSNSTNNNTDMASEKFDTSILDRFDPIQPEQMLKRAFQPLTSRKDNKAQLTFSGYKHTVRKDGSGAFLQIVFSVMDLTGKNPQNICVNSNYKYSENNTLGKLLKIMGYQHESSIVINDEEDEFGYSVVDEDLNLIYLFFDSQKGLIYKGLCESKENTKGQWWYRIQVDSIDPYLNKLGMQKRAYNSSEGFNDDELHVDIIASGGDDEN